MPSSGPNYPASGTDDSAVGTVTWTNPGNITADDNSNAGATGTGGALTHYLKALDFDFGLNEGDTIVGIEVSVGRYASQSGALRYVYDNVVKLVVGGSVVGNNKALTTTKWPLSEAGQSYGGAADLWGLTPTASQINGTDFGVVLAANIYGATGATAYVDYITVTVTYTPAGGATYEDALTVARTAGVSEAGTINLAGAAALARQAGMTLDGLLSISGTLSLARSLAMTTGGGSDYSDSLSLSQSKGMMEDGVLTVNGILDLARAMGMTETVIQQLEDTLSLSQSKGMTLHGVVEMAEALTLARLSWLTMEGGFTWADAVEMGRTLGTEFVFLLLAATAASRVYVVPEEARVVIPVETRVYTVLLENRVLEAA